MQDELKQILKEGKGRAITGKELARRLGERDDRQIRLAIRELIRLGMPIASNSNGYFIVSTPDEAEAYARSLKNRVVEDAIRRRDFKRAATLRLSVARQGRLI